MATDDSNRQQMLTLALLAYRGFWDLHTDDGEEIAPRIERGLTTLAPLRGDWRLVWGPSARRFPGSILDDSVMFVVQGIDEPSRFAVVVRGTNPISGCDWLFGDFLASRQVPWRPGDRVFAQGEAVADEPRVSVSTHLDLAVLTRMRGRPADDWGAPVPAFGWLSDLGGALWRKGRRLLAELGDDVLAQLTALADEARWRYVLVRDELREARRDLERQVATLLSEKGLLVRRAALAVVDRVLDVTADEALAALLPLIERDDPLDDPTGGRLTLLQFLGRVVSQSDFEPRITVTGHSKGGVLASTLALYLADLQGEEGVPESYRWDSQRRATVDCYSFAGPTAGNGAFAAHSDEVIGDRCHRVANRLDVVPHAWNAEALLQAPTLYPPPTRAVPGLKTLADLLAADLAPLDYQHVGKHVDEFVTDVVPSTDSFLEQVLRQHLHAYLRHYDLGGAIGIEDLGF